ncbi:D-amino acid dehydrogenase [Sphingomonas montana]|uniref:D-amino acid dehydrogenase n=1 Tax=Sphingomonas montana TaxID=1843236 RepID=UPI00096CA344|nr:D-amino acid dehydrogenase [Sphingomonas montana]
MTGRSVLVLGGGVVGVATAWYCAQAGCAVTLIERREGVGLETSFANAGQVSPGYSAPWAGPGMQVKALRWLAMKHGPLKVQPRMDRALFAWLIRFNAACTADAYATGKSRMMRLANYSRDQLGLLRAETGIAYDHGQGGTLQLFRTPKQVEAAAKDVAVLRDLGVDHRMLDRDGVLAQEPGLSAATAPIAGGLLLPGDETGDAHLFTRELARMAADAGVTFVHDSNVEAIVADGGRIAHVVAGGRIHRADDVVLALGSYSAQAARPLGLDLPVYPLKGYSLTAPVADPSGAPLSTVMDESYKIGITRLGDRIRVGGTAELAGFDTRLPSKRTEVLRLSLTDLFPRAADLDAVRYWTGLRPATPDGPPIVGASPFANLWLNCGHGTLGWTMACGSGRLIADLITGAAPEIEYGDLSYARYAPVEI